MESKGNPWAPCPDFEQGAISNNMVTELTLWDKIYGNPTMDLMKSVYFMILAITNEISLEIPGFRISVI